MGRSTVIPNLDHRFVAVLRPRLPHLLFVRHSLGVIVSTDFRLSLGLLPETRAEKYWSYRISLTVLLTKIVN